MTVADFLERYPSVKDDIIREVRSFVMAPGLLLARLHCVPRELIRDIFFSWSFVLVVLNRSTSMATGSKVVLYNYYYHVIFIYWGGVARAQTFHIVGASKLRRRVWSNLIILHSVSACRFGVG